ncbi:MAG: carbohydrate ABC transporter permease [Clostridiales bacterium]|nr:carbohydrate ABC transporter permease [Clostridiales bacterium]
MKNRENLTAAIKTVILGIISIAFLLPMIWMITSSLKNTNEVFAVDWKWLPEVFRWDNYKTVWTDPEVSMLNAYANTGFITIVSTAAQLLIASMAAYAFAKINFKGKGVVFTMFLATMMMPTEVTIVPRFILFKTVGLYNNLWAVILPHFFNATSIFMLRQFYIGLPDDLMEAAKIDGASHPTIFARILMPLTKSALISLMVLSFISCWNEYMAPLIFLVKKNLYTISQVIRWYMLDDLQRYDLNMAAATSAIIPVVILFIICQRYFVEGIATSGIKG